MCYWASLVASDWVSGLICIISLSTVEWLWPSSIISDRVRQSSPLHTHTHLHLVPLFHPHFCPQCLSSPPLVPVHRSYCGHIMQLYTYHSNLISSNFFSSHFFLSPSYMWWYIEEAILVLNSQFGVHHSNKVENLINLFSPWYQGDIKHTPTPHTH